MKKIYGKIIILLIAICLIFMGNFAIGQESTYTTNASVLGTAAYIEDGYISILDYYYAELWNSSTGSGLRSDSYIEDAAGEVLEINAYITDPDGFYFGEYITHNVEGIIRDINISHSITLNYIRMIDTDTALFRNYITISNSGTQDVSAVNITCYDIYDNSSDETEIFSPLYVNPITSVTFSPDQVNWTGLYKGTDRQASGYNPYVLTFSATCDNLPVSVGYNLSIRGTDLTITGSSDLIPINKMNCTLNSGADQSVTYAYELLNSLKLIANTGQNLDFYLSVPGNTPVGDYSGSIDLQIEREI